MKKFIAGLLVGSLFSGILISAESGLQIVKNPFQVVVNRLIVPVEGYNINNYTYLKLSDLRDYLGINIYYNKTSKQIEVDTLNQPKLAKFTSDGLKIYTFSGKDYVSTFDVQEKFRPNCLVVGSIVNKKLKIYKKSVIAAWDLDYITPALVTDNYESIENGNYFEVSYYEGTIKPLLEKSVEKKSSYQKDGYDIYLMNNIEYVKVCDLTDAYSFKKYRFEYLYNYEAMNIKSLTNNKTIIENMPVKVVDESISIEYSYLKNVVIPAISQNNNTPEK